MKKLILVSLVSLVVFMFTGCDNKDAVQKAEEDVSSEVSEPECSVNSDCFQLGHSFCNEGFCNGEPPYRFEDVTADTTEEVEDDVVADSLTEEEVNLPECSEDVDCDDSNVCAVAVCADGSCLSEQKGDGIVCGTSSFCFTGACVNCNDVNICTSDTMYASNGACEHWPILDCCNFDSDCDDGNPCTDGGGKQPEKCIDNQCYIVPIPNYGLCGPDWSGMYCYEGACLFFDCDDGDECTYDFVNSPEGNCAHAPISGGPDDCPVFVGCGTDDDCGVGGGVICLTETIRQGSWQTGQCIDGQCEVVVEELECAFGCNPLFGQCFECAVDQNCDDGLDCTMDICEQGYCSTETKCYDIFDCVGTDCIYNTLTASCFSDADCNLDPICDNTLGGVLEFTGACLSNGFCEMTIHDDPNWGQMEGCFPAQPCADSSECEFGGVCAKYFCFWMNGNPACATDWDCDDGLDCTTDICEQGYCSTETKCYDIFDCVGGDCIYNTLTASCSSDADCNLDPICDNTLGGVLEFTGACLSNGFCEMTIHDDPNWGQMEGCFPAQPCADSSECEFGGVCAKYFCFWMNGNPACATDWDCVDDNPCTFDACVNNHCQHTPVGNCIPCEVDADCVDLDPYCDWFIGGVVTYDAEVCDPYLNRCTQSWIFDDLGKIAMNGCAEPIGCEVDADCPEPSAWCTEEGLCFYPFGNIPTE